MRQERAGELDRDLKKSIRIGKFAGSFRVFVGRIRYTFFTPRS